MNLADAKAVITGGSSGLGLAVVECLLDAGARVSILDRQAPDPTIKSSDLVKCFSVDVTSEVEVGVALNQAVESMQGLTLVVNCAGVALAQRVLGRAGVMTQASFKQVVDINLVGTFTVCAAAAALMQHNTPGAEGERGVIVNTASIAAFDGQVGLAAYAAAKGGVVSMTLPLARELSAYGLRVVCIAPGLFATPMTTELPEAVRNDLLKLTPFPHRFGQPTEFAQLVAQVYENTMLNGTTIRLDGGLRMP
jgi:3-hydroxyacyl-CoA dehydrogenase / 3-hydroxy-2-methylbutyryl-CoA dehydrogenase